MAVIHRTSLEPSKLELLAAWLPRQSWYVGAKPQLSKVGGFRLDDPAGAVGIEFMLVADRSTPRAILYSVPMTYRDAPIVGASTALIGCTDHGVLARRWVYDADQDRVFTEQVIALMNGTAVAQHQDLSDTFDPAVTVCKRPEDVAAFHVNRRPDSSDIGRTGQGAVCVRLPGTDVTVAVLEADD